MSRASLTAQLQQAWLQTQMPRAPKPIGNSSSSLSAEATASLSSNEALERQSSSVRSSSAVSGEALDSPSPASTSAVWSPSLASDSLSEPLSSPGSRVDSGKAWDIESKQEGVRQDPTQAYLTDLLADEDLCKQKCMLTDCMRLQAMHSELADLIGNVESGLDFSDGPDSCGYNPSADVGAWMESLLSASPPNEDDFMLPELPLDDVACDAGGPCSSGDGAGSSAIADFDTAELGFPELPSLNGAAPSTGAEFPPLASFGGSTAPSPGPDFRSNGAAVSEPRYVQEPESLEVVIRSLLECAQAVNADDVAVADMLVGKLRQISTPYGSSLQRVTHYFVEGLVARLSGTGADLFTAFNKGGPSAVDILRANQLYVDHVPHLRMAHSFASSHLLEAFQGAQKVHIIDYGILYGYQWPSFLQALATRPEGPPKLVRITGIEFPQPGLNPDQRVKETGRKLKQFADGLGIAFEYKAVADKWENVHPSSVNLKRDEVLAVSCIYRLRHLLDESVLPSSPRRTVLQRIRMMNPKIFVTAVVNMAGNVPFYTTRLRESITNYNAHFEALDATVPRDNWDRHLIESEVMARDILNIVSCEGVQRIERPEPYTQWQRRLVQAGFQQIPVKESLFNSTREILRGFHGNFGIGQDENWLLLGWKDVVQHALAAWKPK